MGLHERRKGISIAVDEKLGHQIHYFLDAQSLLLQLFTDLYRLREHCGTGDHQTGGLFQLRDRTCIVLDIAPKVFLRHRLGILIKLHPVPDEPCINVSHRYRQIHQVRNTLTGRDLLCDVSRGHITKVFQKLPQSTVCVAAKGIGHHLCDQLIAELEIIVPVGQPTPKKPLIIRIGQLPHISFLGHSPEPLFEIVHMIQIQNDRLSVALVAPAGLGQRKHGHHITDVIEVVDIGQSLVRLRADTGTSIGIGERTFPPGELLRGQPAGDDIGTGSAPAVACDPYDPMVCIHSVLTERLTHGIVDTVRGRHEAFMDGNFLSQIEITEPFGVTAGTLHRDTISHIGLPVMLDGLSGDGISHMIVVIDRQIFHDIIGSRIIQRIEAHFLQHRVHVFLLISRERHRHRSLDKIDGHLIGIRQQHRIAVCELSGTLGLVRNAAGRIVIRYVFESMAVKQICPCLIFYGTCRTNNARQYHTQYQSHKDPISKLLHSVRLPIIPITSRRLSAFPYKSPLVFSSG